ncbi:MAG: SDR family oxidoreductase [Ignavibacteriaceae bacterium]|nr:SDR family oxidoreductase [Ignavibacteriaceae bacterium]
MLNKTILISGSTDGIGKQTAFELADMGATILVHGRDLTKGRNTVKELTEKTGNKKIFLHIADFSSQHQIRRMAREINDKYERLDVLINNAAVFMKSRELTEDNIEMTFAVNHLAPFLLTFLLVELLKKSAPSRIINISSASHLRGKLDFGNLQGEKKYDGYDSYSISKLGNLLFTYELAERLKDTGVTVNALHPGVIATKILSTAFNLNGDNLIEGASTPVYMASSDDLNNVTGKYFVKKEEAASSGLSNDKELQKKFWELSEKLCSID